MEKRLSVWIEDQNQKTAPVDGPIIRRKAISIYNYLKKEAQPDEETEEAESSPAPSSSSFPASRGWFDKFKIRYNLHNVKLAGEAASADVEAATEYPKEVQKLIRGERLSARASLQCRRDRSILEENAQ